MLKIKDIINLIDSHANYEVIGSYSGHKIFNNYSSNRIKQKYENLEVVEKPIFTEIKSKGNYAYSIIKIWARDYDIMKNKKTKAKVSDDNG